MKRTLKQLPPEVVALEGKNWRDVLKALLRIRAPNNPIADNGTAPRNPGEGDDGETAPVSRNETDDTKG